MNVFTKITQVSQSAPELLFSNATRIILMSDCHRGDNSRADDFVSNEPLCLAALKYYYFSGFHYFELGDADELWQFDIAKIEESHREVFQWLCRFQQQNRYFSILGNHDVFKKETDFWRTGAFCNGAKRTIESREGVILRHRETGLRILLIHGHQADPINDRFWRFGYFLSRFIWRPIELKWGIPDPISPAKNHRKKNIIEQRLVNWVQKNQQVIIAGHTHRPVFPSTAEAPYFNCGSCLHPDGITGIEITGGKISLVKWANISKRSETSFVGRTVLAGPEPLIAFARYFSVAV